MKKTYRLFFSILSGAMLMSAAAAAQDQGDPQTAEVKGSPQQATNEAEPAAAGVSKDAQNETSPPAPSEEERLGALEVVSNPAGARVFVTNDESYPAEEIGDTPLLEKSAPGTYWVNVAMDGYEEITVKVQVNPGEKTIVTVDLASLDGSYHAKRVAGHSLLWPGIGVVAAGVVLIEIEPQGNIGAVGFVTAGVGVALTIAGGILLGLSHHDDVIYEQPPIALAPLPDLSGGGILFSKSF